MSIFSVGNKRGNSGLFVSKPCKLEVQFDFLKTVCNLFVICPKIKTTCYLRLTESQIHSLDCWQDVLLIGQFEI